MKQYKKGDSATFYIQCKGLHSGKPLRSPIPNCFAVYTDIEGLFELVYSLYKGRNFEPIICGSVIPFVKISQVQTIIRHALETVEFTPKQRQQLDTIGKIDALIAQKHEQIALLLKMQAALCRAVLT